MNYDDVFCSRPVERATGRVWEGSFDKSGGNLISISNFFKMIVIFLI